jgi:DNA-binding LacI/PurR family transcriptional regulator
MLLKKPKAVTQHDVATLVGVSQRTVSRCFLQPEAIHPATRARILDVARQKGYHPNRAARIIRSGRSEHVTLLRDTGAPDSYIHSSFLWSVHQCLGEHNLDLAVRNFPSGSCESGGPVPLLSDGVVVPCHSGLPEEAGAFARRLSMPVVWVNTPGSGDCVCPNDRCAGRDATEHLLRLGHRRIAFVAQPPPPARDLPGYCNGSARLEGYREAMRAAGLAPRLLQPGEGETLDATVSLYRHVLALSDRPTGLVVCRPKEAQAAVFATYACHGMQVPRDLSIVTFSDELPWMAPRLTAWVTPWKTLGRLAVEMLVARMRMPESRSASRFIPMEMAPGVTCGKPQAS